MSKSVEKIQVFYEIAMSIGKSQDLHEMLKTAMLAYIRKLNCVAAMVYRIKPSTQDGFWVEDLFSIPYTLNIHRSYQKIAELLCRHFSPAELDAFMKSMPYCSHIEPNQYFHVMELENFGLLVLIKSGKPFDRDILHTIEDLNKKLSRASVACINIRALEESEKRYRDLAEFLPEMICEIDLSGRVTYVNNYAIQKMEYTLSDIEKGIQYAEIFHPDDQARVRRNFNTALKNDNRSPTEYRALTRSGEELAVIVHTNRLIRDHKTVGLRGVMIDISVRKRAEEERRKTEIALKESEAKLKQNLRQQEHVSEVLFEAYSADEFDVRLNNVLEKTGRFSSWSRVFIFEDLKSDRLSCNTFEWCNDSISCLMADFQDFSHGDYPTLKSVLEQEGMLYAGDCSALQDDLLELSRRRGAKSLLIFPMLMEGKIRGFVGFEDCRHNRQLSTSEQELYHTVSGIISTAYERRTMEQSIISERDKAKQANVAKSEFLANMSHEIRTPMNAILGFSEALYHDLQDRKHSKMIKSVLNSGNMLLSLLNDILDLSRVEAGRLDISIQPVDLTNILQDIKQLYMDKAENKGIQLDVFYPADFPRFLMLDEIRIKQVIFNLVGNAIKFTHKGHVHIHADFMNTSDEVGQLLIEVKDTGIGIPESQQELIFEPFRQQSGQSTRKYGGAGLGLPISRRLVERMGGSIEVKSTNGEGSQFRVMVHCVRTSGTESRKPDTFGEVFDIHFKPASILVVDDVHSNIATVEALLDSSELTVSGAESGEIALEFLNHTIPDLILMDIRMPVMDGYQLAREIKSNAAWSAIPLVALTASTFDSEQIKASGNFEGLLFKPVSQADLYKEFSGHLPYQAGSGQSAAQTPSGEDLLAPLSAQIMDQLPEIVQVLQEEFLPEWETIKDQLVLFKIEKFAVKLKGWSRDKQLKYLIHYADTLLQELEAIDLEALAGTLDKFPMIVTQIAEKLNPTSHE